MRLERQTGFPPPGEPGLFWLGQAGFWIDTGVHRVLIDPYLSDSLARKYAGRRFPHIRMMAPPVALAELPEPDLVLVTHGHSDHMDPDTLAPLHARFPDLPFLVPAAELELARTRIGAKAPLIPADAGQVLEPLPGLEITVFPAAHETLDKDDAGRHHYLGYGIAHGDLRIYHSGDSIPFDGLDELVQGFVPHIALLPVNGRDEDRRAAGVPGNFTLAEACALARECAFLVPHHFGMFDFNTLDPAAIDRTAAAHPGPLRILRPQAGEWFRIVI